MRAEEAQMIEAFRRVLEDHARDRQVSHAKPLGPPRAYKAFHILSPLSTHFRIGTCEEVGCLAQRNGWVTTPDPAKILEADPSLSPSQALSVAMRQADYIRRESRRKFTERQTEAGLSEFTFEAGQKCFATHQVSLERPEFFAVGAGDWRQYSLPRLHSGPDAWVNDFGENQERINRARNG